MSPTGAPLAILMEMPKFGAGIGLHRVEWLCRELLGGPWLGRLDAFKVTGSNGKGSTCAMIAAILRELGIVCGLYTSPHLLTFHERIKIDGLPIGDADLTRAVRWMLARRDEYETVHPGDKIGAFEAFTALALYHFGQVRPETMVAEAGIGGRYDPTRIIPGRFAGLTSLDLEHTEILGPTIELIAYDKADICPDGGVLVLGEVHPEVHRRLVAYCHLRSIQLIDTAARVRKLAIGYYGDRMVVDLEIDGTRLDNLTIGLLGDHQVSNAVVALLLVREWLALHRPGLSSDEFEGALRRGLSTVEWPGRLQRISRDPDVYVDVGHTPGAVYALVQAVVTILRGHRLILVIGVSYDKQVEGIVTQLLPLADRVVCTRAYHKGSAVTVIEEIVRRYRPDIPVHVEEQVEEAMRQAVALAREHSMTVLVAGGLFLSIEAVQALGGGNPRALRFF